MVIYNALWEAIYKAMLYLDYEQDCNPGMSGNSHTNATLYSAVLPSLLHHQVNLNCLCSGSL